MEKETLILQELFIPVLQKDERFDDSKCDNAFWHKMTVGFVDFEQDKKPFFALVYSLELADVENVIAKLEKLFHPFLDQLAEENVQGFSSHTTQKLTEENLYFKERVLFYNDLRKAIFLSERKRIKSELPSMYDKYSFELDEGKLVEAITKLERQSLKDKMKVWNKELISEESEQKVVSLNATKNNTSVFSLTWIKYAVAACFVLGLGVWFYDSQNNLTIPADSVVTQPKVESTPLDLPKPVIVKTTTITKITDVLVNEGLGFNSTSKQIKIISINNNNRIKSINTAIEIYQNFIEKEILVNPNDGLKNKKIHLEIQRDLKMLQNELIVLNAKQNTYLFDGKELILNEVMPTIIKVVEYENEFYFKKGNDFYTLTETSVPLQFTKVKNNILKDNLEQILFTNGE
jgi:hypothetical protein